MNIIYGKRSIVDDIQKAIDVAESNCETIELIELTEWERDRLLIELGEPSGKIFNTYKDIKVSVVEQEI